MLLESARNLIRRKSVGIIVGSIRKNRSVFFLGLVISTVGAVTSVILPYLTKLEVDQLVAGRGFAFFGTDYGAFGLLAVILAAYFLVSLVEKIVTESLQEFLKEREEIFRHDTELFLYERISRMEIGIALPSGFQNVLGYVDNKLDHILKVVTDTPKSVLGLVIRLGGIGGILLSLDPKILALVVAGGVANHFIGRMDFRNKFSMEHDSKIRNVDFSIYSTPWEIRNNLGALTQNGSMRSILAAFTKNVYEKQRLVRPYQRKRTLIGSAIFFVDSLVSILIRGGVGYLVFEGTSSVGMVAMAVLYADKLSDIARTATEMFFDIQKIRFDLAFFEEFLKISAPVGNAEGTGTIEKSVTFRNVVFKYPDSNSLERPFIELLQGRLKFMKASGDSAWEIERLGDDLTKFEHEAGKSEGVAEPVLRGFDYAFSTGKIYGIVGRNGAGKTTLINLVSGFFRSYGGEILFDGTDIRNWKIDGFSNVISVMSQVPYTYGIRGECTIRNNLLLGVRRTVSDEEMFELLKKFRLDAKIRSLRLGLDSEIWRDTDFSGGEFQLLAFIRILLQDRPVIVLDEGTNQLDAENEALVMKHLLANRTGKIILFITHRMNTIARADEVLCVEDGIVAARGKPKDLLEAGDNAYARFYRTQILHEEVSDEVR